MSLYLSSSLCDCIEPLTKLVNPHDYTLAVIANASDMYDDPFWVGNDVKSLRDSGFEIMNVDLRIAEDVSALLSGIGYNGIFIAGGNSFYLLELLKKTSVFEYIKNSLQNILYIGSSAGSVICSPAIDIIKYLDKTLDSSEYELTGFGVVPFQILPHFGHTYFKARFDKLFLDEDFYNSMNTTLRDCDSIWVKDGCTTFLTSQLNQE